jgi:hypothetical protein
MGLTNAFGSTLTRDGRGQYECDRCGRPAPQGTTMFGDRDANYDLCGGCYAEAVPGARVVVDSTRPPA